MSMKSSHTDALAGEAAVDDALGGESSASAPLLVGSVMRGGSSWGAHEAVIAAPWPQCAPAHD
jgi:hypothetical protein